MAEEAVAVLAAAPDMLAEVVLPVVPVDVDPIAPELAVLKVAVVGVVLLILVTIEVVSVGAVVDAVADAAATRGALEIGTRDSAGSEIARPRPGCPNRSSSTSSEKWSEGT